MAAAASDTPPETRDNPPAVAGTRLPVPIAALLICGFGVRVPGGAPRGTIPLRYAGSVREVLLFSSACKASARQQGSKGGPWPAGRGFQRRCPHLTLSSQGRARGVGPQGSPPALGLPHRSGPGAGERRAVRKAATQRRRSITAALYAAFAPPRAASASGQGRHSAPVRNSRSSPPNPGAEPGDERGSGRTGGWLWLFSA